MVCYARRPLLIEEQYSCKNRKHDKRSRKDEPKETKIIILHVPIHSMGFSSKRKPNKRILFCYAVIGCLLVWMIKTSSMASHNNNNNNNSNTRKNNEASRVQYQQTEQGTLTSGAPFLKYQAIYNTGELMTMKQWTNTLLHDYESFNDILSSCPFEAFFWECAPTIDGSNRMEFVLVDAPALAQFARNSPDRIAFQEHFLQQQSVAVFPSLGKDAMLLAPNTRVAQAFTDIAVFARHASASQRKDMYQRLSRLLQEHDSKQPLWLSTSGMGIAWMHIRLDSRPKYYTYTPFKML